MNDPSPTSERLPPRITPLLCLPAEEQTKWIYRFSMLSRKCGVALTLDDEECKRIIALNNAQTSKEDLRIDQDGGGSALIFCDGKISWIVAVFANHKSPTDNGYGCIGCPTAKLIEYTKADPKFVDQAVRTFLYILGLDGGTADVGRMVNNFPILN